MIIKDILLKAVGYDDNKKLIEDLEVLTKGDSYIKDVHISENITYVNKNISKCIEFNTKTFNTETGKISSIYQLVDFNNDFYTLLKTDYESLEKSIYSLELYTYTSNKLIGSIRFNNNMNNFVFVLCKEYIEDKSLVYGENYISNLMLYSLPKIYSYLSISNKLLEEYNRCNVDQDLKTIFSTNLYYYMTEYNKSCSNISEVLNIPYSTVNDWVNGKSYPRITQIQELADYFNISKSDLIEQQKDRFYNIYKSYIKEY